MITLPSHSRLDKELLISSRVHQIPRSNLSLSRPIIYHTCKDSFSVQGSHLPVPGIRTCVSSGPFFILPQTSNIGWIQLVSNFITPTSTWNSFPKLNMTCASRCHSESLVMLWKWWSWSAPLTPSYEIQTGLQSLIIYCLFTFRQRTDVLGCKIGQCYLLPGLF